MEINDTYFTPNPSALDIDTSFREIAEHGNLLFPVGIHYTNHNFDEEIMIHKHWHRELEILYIAENSMIVEIENNSFLASEGDVFLIPPNYLHAAYQHKNLPCTFYAIVFDVFFISSYTNDQVQQSYIEPILKDPSKYLSYLDSKKAYSKEIRTVILSIIQNFNKSYGYEILIKSKLLEFFYFFYLMHPKENLIDQKKEDILASIRVKKILLFIDDNFREPITLDMISSSVGISKEHFCRFFKKHFHVSFSEYLMRRRITTAGELLAKTNLSVTEIAFDVGFDSANYFTAVFKKITGKTPSHFRKELKRHLL